jgi:ADP-ribose pyrophosphatase
MPSDYEFKVGDKVRRKKEHQQLGWDLDEKELTITSIFPQWIAFNQIIGLFRKDWFELVTESQEKDYGPGPHLAADAVVICRHYILLVTRKDGTFALPGGKVEPGETTKDAAKRECLEETGFDIKKFFKNEGRNLYRTGFLFDNPKRDPRNHVVTIAHYFPCQSEGVDMPVVVGKDDADDANWYSLLKISSFEDKFFADHFKIITEVLHSV